MSKASIEAFVNQLSFEDLIETDQGRGRGQRVHPVRDGKKDGLCNYRVDKGSVQADGSFDLVIQPNKSANDKSVRQLANKDSHQVLATLRVDPNQPIDDKEEALLATKLLGTMNANREKKQESDKKKKGKQEDGKNNKRGKKKRSRSFHLI